MNINHKLSSSPVIFPALVTSAILLVPLVAMQFTDEVSWTLSDFIIGGTLLFSTGLAYKLVTKKTGHLIYRTAIAFMLFSMLFLVWINLAVGIFGSEGNPVNIAYFAVIAIGIIGAIITRFRSYGMSLTMFLMALTQSLITIFILLSKIHHRFEITVFEVLSLNGLFTMLFIIPALLFHHHAKEQVLSKK